MTTKSENGIRLVQECVAGENAQDYDRTYSVFVETATYYLNGEILGSAPTADFRDLEKKTTPGIYGNSHREIQWIDGNDTRVVYQYKIQFNHNGEVFGFPPTGRRVEFHGVSIAEHDGNEIRLIRLFADQGEMNRQLSGKLRTPGTVSAALEGPDPRGRVSGRATRPSGRGSFAASTRPRTSATSRGSSPATPTRCSTTSRGGRAPCPCRQLGGSCLPGGRACRVCTGRSKRCWRLATGRSFAGT
ncbi:MAG: ester cyclase [Dehalococcoidia bacterium]|nr:ester cyclase [Dehalococcoidia bacterium]